MTAQPYLHVGDTGDLTLTIMDGAVAADLTSCTPTVLLTQPSGTTVTLASVVDTPATGGTITATLVAASLSASGDYQLQVILTYPAKVRRTVIETIRVHGILVAS